MRDEKIERRRRLMMILTDSAEAEAMQSSS